ncbi:MAG: hypothetical protein DHS20C18_47780 [Saprospiraceae bacterium]|nr:MAG: hypothetical protein DHS20C18_47780 [Saprospiraceae bacterium]
MGASLTLALKLSPAAVAFGEGLSALLREGRVGAWAAKDHFSLPKTISKQTLKDDQPEILDINLLRSIAFCSLFVLNQDKNY